LVEHQTLDLIVGGSRPPSRTILKFKKKENIMGDYEIFSNLTFFQLEILEKVFLFAENENLIHTDSEKLLFDEMFQDVLDRKKDYSDLVSESFG
jgi:hypothetical protein